MLQPVLDDAEAPAPANAGVVHALTGGAVVVAALYFGQELFVPLVLATLLAFVLAPATTLLQRAYLPRVAAVLLAVLLAFMAIGALGTIVGHQARILAGNAPQYEATVLTKWHGLTDTGGLLARFNTPSKPTSGHPASANALNLDGSSVLSLVKQFAPTLLGPLATAGVVLIFTLFILLYSEDLRDRFVRLVGRQDLHRTIFALNDAGRRLSRYFLFQLMLNASFGLLIGTALAVIGLPGAILWGILAMLMRFVPFIGTFIALAPPLALAIATAPGWSMAILVLTLFVGSELIMGQVVEPLIYGHSTGLSPIAVIVATAFWALLWGPVGLLLATPLTVCLVVIGRHVEKLSFFDVIFGDTSPLLPPETFYQRALESKASVLERTARAQIGAGSLADYYDHVALCGLILAQRDRTHDALAFERLEAVHDHIEKLLVALAPEAAPSLADSQLPEPWRREGAVICLPGRGQLDDLAATMATQVMGQGGFGARFEPNLVLDAAVSQETDMSHVRLCCLSVMEAGSTVSGIQYFVRRIEKTMPNAVIAVGLWQASGDSPLLAALRAAGQEEHLVLSLGELLAFAKAISAQREPALV